MPDFESMICFFTSDRSVRLPDAHHEELLQVAPEDGDEVQALKQGHRLVGALVEHALIEREP